MNLKLKNTTKTLHSKKIKKSAILSPPYDPILYIDDKLRSNKNLSSSCLFNVLNNNSNFSIKDLRDILFNKDGSLFHSNTSLCLLGGKETNHGSIEKNKEPIVVLTENITNMIDEVCIKKWEERGCLENEKKWDQSTMAHKYFGIPIHDGTNSMRRKDRSKIADEIGTVTLLPSSTTKSKQDLTLLVRDNGRGIKTENFASTILSIENGNKTDFHWTTGQYGFGGCSTYSKQFVDFTFIASCHQDEPNKVSFTIVFCNWEEGHRFSMYYYLMIDENIPTIAKKDIILNKKDEYFHNYQEDFKKPGTLKKHFGYNLEGDHITIGSNQGEHSLYQRIKMELADNKIPFHLKDIPSLSTIERSKTYHNGRTVNSLRHDIEGSENLEWKHSMSINLFSSKDENRPIWYKGGNIHIRLSVFKPHEEDGNSSKYKKNYFFNDKCGVVCEHSQTHYYYDQRFLRNFKYPYLKNHLYIMIITDGVDGFDKSNIFTSNRDGLARTEITELMREKIISHLENLEELKVLNEKFRMASLNKISTNENKKLRRLIASILYKGISPGDDSNNKNNKIPSINIKDVIPLPINDPPTILEFSSRYKDSPKSIHLGMPTYIRAKTDAPINFINTRDNKNSRIASFILDAGMNPVCECSLGEIQSNNRFSIRVDLKENSGLREGDYGYIYLYYKEDRTLSDRIQFKIIPIPEKKDYPGSSIPLVQIIKVKASVMNIDENQKKICEKVSLLSDIPLNKLVQDFSIYFDRKGDGEAYEVYYNREHPTLQNILLRISKNNLEKEQEVINLVEESIKTQAITKESAKQENKDMNNSQDITDAVRLCEYENNLASFRTLCFLVPLLAFDKESII